MNKWVRYNKLSDLFGFTKGMIDGKVRDGWWVENVHWRKGPDGQRYFKVEAIDRWIEGELPHAVNQ